MTRHHIHRQVQARRRAHVTRRVSTIVVVVLCLTAAATACGDSDTSAASSTTTVAVETTTSTGPLPQDTRSRLTRRLTEELDDAGSAQTVVAGLDDSTMSGIEEMTGGDIENSPTLSYAPSTVPADDIDSLWLFSFGFRIDPDSGVAPVELSDPPPPMDVLTPGPANEALARAAADFVAEHPMPIIAQWEVARVLDQLGVDDVISVEPKINPDGSVVYLSSPAVAIEGLKMAQDRGIDVGHAGVLCVPDFEVACLLSARRAGLHADAPEAVEVPADYDPDSGQLWTRSRTAWLPIELLGRTFLAR